jgi:anaerobic selenocysteine-containing dehydrogenase
MVWGVNIPATRSNKYREFVQAVKKGMKVISIDPLQTGIAGKADLWLRTRPGTDLALGLGMIHVIIKERLYDREFVEKWTVGFDELKAHVQEYPPERVSDITWIPSDLIIEAARMYAGNRPARIEWGNALDQQLDSFQAARAVSILMAITGNLGVPGGEEETRGSGFRDADPDKESSQIGVLGRWSRELELRHMMKAEDRKRKVGPDLLPDFRYVLPQSVVKAILQDDPYPIRAMFIQASNPLSCWPNLQKTLEAFQGLDFLAVSDMFMTQTAAMADIVFPAASYLEYDGVQITPQGTIAQFQRKVAQIGECRSDHEIINGLARQLGLGEFFWDSIDAFWDTILAPAGLTFEELGKRDRFVGKTGQKEYRQYEKSGFKTPSGKVEIYSEQLGRWGFDPLPTYGEAPGNPDQAGEYPLLCTTWKLGVYRHSGGRQIPSLRRVHPEPRVIIHPEAAAERGIAQGDWVTIETPSGMITQKANVSALVDPRVVVADHAWWFPERDGKDLFGFQDANYNVLTTDRPPYNREMGSFSIRGIACNVFRK